MPLLNIEEKNLELSNLDKVYYPKINLTKGEVLDYYIKIAPYILPHIKNRPFSMLNFPDGVEGKNFYRKQCPADAPEWLQTIKIPSETKGDINWCMVNDLASLIWMANRSCIEMHTWFSRAEDLKKPDIAVMDLDPSGNAGFKEAVIAAKGYHILLDELKITAFPKTSGATGIHIVIPIEPIYTFEEVRFFLIKLSKIITDTYPQVTTTQRTISKRGDKIYLDAVQNASGKTIPAPYSLRATQDATVSAPLLWKELDENTLSPENFTIYNIFERIQEKGDLVSNIYGLKQRLPKI